MATLQDFQNAANEITTAAQNITNYLQNAGMSSADQEIALKSIQDAITTLNTAIQPTLNP